MKNSHFTRAFFHLCCVSFHVEFYQMQCAPNPYELHEKSKKEVVKWSEIETCEHNGRRTKIYKKKKRKRSPQSFESQQTMKMYERRRRKRGKAQKEKLSRCNIDSVAQYLQWARCLQSYVIISAAKTKFYFQL